MALKQDSTLSHLTDLECEAINNISLTLFRFIHHATEQNVDQNIMFRSRSVKTLGICQAFHATMRR